MRERRRIVPWIAGSLAIHVLLIVLIALLIGPGGDARIERAPLTATLTTPLQTFAVQEFPPPPASADARTSVPSHTEAVPLTLPIKPTLRPRDKATPGGQVTVNVTDSSEPLEPALEAVLRQFYPGAERAAVEFDVLPTAIYPKAALADQRNVQLRVLVIIHEDGRVELAKGSLHDRLFMPSIREALTSARVLPAADQGRPPVAWAVLLFIYEFIGAT